MVVQCAHRVLGPMSLLLRTVLSVYIPLFYKLPVTPGNAVCSIQVDQILYHGRTMHGWPSTPIADSLAAYIAKDLPCIAAVRARGPIGCVCYPSVYLQSIEHAIWLSAWFIKCKHCPALSRMHSPSRLSMNINLGALHSREATYKSNSYSHWAIGVLP